MSADVSHQKSRWFSRSVHIYRSKAHRKQQNMFLDIKINVRAQMEWKLWHAEERRILRRIPGCSEVKVMCVRLMLVIMISINVQTCNVMFAWFYKRFARWRHLREKHTTHTHTHTSNSRNTKLNFFFSHQTFFSLQNVFLLYIKKIPFFTQKHFYS